MFFVAMIRRYLVFCIGGKEMRKYFGTVLTAVVVITLAVLGFALGGVSFSSLQQETFITLLIICGVAALYCFIVGELSHNNSQMDKLWSILPIVYTWVVAAKGNMAPRLVIYAVIVTLWGIRLTINFARKGAYRLRFWEGEEDYRWLILRENKMFKGHRVRWAMFNLFFISIYQNALVLFMTVPAIACMDSAAPFGVCDYLAIGFATTFLLIETAADEQQMSFYTTRNKLLKEGRKLEELPEPFSKGFNTTGLWGRARHPNYLGEQGIWLALYLFAIGAGAAKYGIFNWTMVGPLFIILLFLGSSSFGESISNMKYPEYHIYLAHVSKYIPLWKYKPEKYKNN